MCHNRSWCVPCQAMAHSVRGLRQSTVLCGLKELPLILDLLQGSEAVTAVLRRSGLVARSALLNVTHDKFAGRGRQKSCRRFSCCRPLFAPTFSDNCLLYLIIVIPPYLTILKRPRDGTPVSGVKGARSWRF